VTDDQFPDLTLHLTGKTLTQPVPIELLSATKEATGDATELPHFEQLTSSDIPHHYSYDGPLLRDWIRFKLPTSVKAGRYTLHICQRGKCQALQPFRLLSASSAAAGAARAK
jgi:hypothetical protein